MSEMLESNLKRSRGELNIVNDTPFMTDILQSELKRQQKPSRKIITVKGEKNIGVKKNKTCRHQEQKNAHSSGENIIVK